MTTSLQSAVLQVSLSLLLFFASYTGRKISASLGYVTEWKGICKGGSTTPDTLSIRLSPRTFAGWPPISVFVTVNEDRSCDNSTSSLLISFRKLCVGCFKLVVVASVALKSLSVTITSIRLDTVNCLRYI
jgi:hypothetical protein